MFYRKNIYSWEQLLRIVGGFALAVYALIAMPSTTVGYALIAVGVFTAITGIFGFCPACAMVGRRLKEPVA